MPREVLAMSDEDFLKLSSPPAVESTGEDVNQQQEVQQPVEQETDSGVTTGADPATASNTEGSDATTTEESQAVEEDSTSSKDTSNGGTFADKKSGEQGGESQTDPNTSAAGQAAKTNPEESKDASAPGSTEQKTTATPDYEGFYKQMIGPLKANGRTIEVQSPEEAIQLMRMGANYTHKMQAMAPHRKVLMMLQNNGMLDEGQLSFAIDLVKHKNPEAIKKLLKESGVDPLEIDTTTEPTYREGNHRVTDTEAAFVTVLEDLRSNQGGDDTLRVINTQWDQASKDELWKTPDIMQVIHEQRASGIYDRVATEVERLKVLGAIPAQVPFLHAYKQVGDELAKAGKLNDLVPAAAQVAQAQQQKTTPAAPVVTTVLKPKPTIKNGDKARAAAATQSNPKTAETKTNPLAMSDEEFMKQMANRH